MLCVTALVLAGVGLSPAPAAVAMPTTLLNFTGQADSGFVSPPDPMGAAGPNHYVQVVNLNIEVWNKSGAVVSASKPLKSLWTGYVGTNAGNGCSARNDGDPIVRYDQMADRWLIAQFSPPNQSTTGGPAFECVAISKTGDPTGAYWLYDFKTNASINDQTKIGVWSDGYYETSNLYNASGGGSFAYAGAQVCAWDRTSMLAGQAATQQCFNAGTSYFGLLAANVDGSVPPPAGAPEEILAEDPTTANALDVWQVHVDWTTPANTTFTGPTALATQAFTDACAAATDPTACVPQGGSTTKLEPQGNLLMDRLSYRNFGTHESLLVTKSATAGAGSGIAWWELRLPSGAPTIYQQGIYAPNDVNWRWMPSAAMDQAGDIAVGYSISSAAGNTHPSIAWTGRLASDALGSMGTQAEAVTTAGLGNETSGTRWGDYSSMTVDPTDDCTFWYTNEIYTSAGDWTTKVATTKFPKCGANNFSLSADPSLSVAQGTSGGAAITTALATGVAESVDLAVSGLPTGATASFAPASVTAGSGSTLTVTSGAATPPGTYPLLVTGTAANAYHGTTLSLTVTANTVPACTNQPNVTTPQDTAAPLLLQCLDPDAGDTVAYSITSEPLHGNVSAPDSGGNVTYTPTSGYNGPDSFGFAGTDSHGAKSPTATVSITVTAPDTTNPSVGFTAGPAAYVHSTSADLSFTVSDTDNASDALTVTCALDGADPTPCTSPQSLSGLSQGSHTLLVSAKDPANNTGSASRTWFVDTTAPTGSTTAPTLRLTTVAHVVATSTAADVGSGVLNRDYRYRRAAYNAGFGPLVYPAGWQATTTSSVSVTAAVGYTYCISVRVRDKAGNVSGWSAEKCTALALDDRALAAGTGWSRVTGTPFYLHTATSTTKLGATLTRTGLATDRLGLVATVCATCGKVAVYLNGKLFTTVSLVSTSTHYARLISLPTLSLRSATVTLKVVTSGKLVQIDGLASSRV
ncbi:MAG: hypothetical protein QOC82_1316 [Frankiaceae bacterium]|nr:hypothetical protein [Frankiaceae bacterium]